MVSRGENRYRKAFIPVHESLSLFILQQLPLNRSGVQFRIWEYHTQIKYLLEDKEKLIISINKKISGEGINQPVTPHKFFSLRGLLAFIFLEVKL